MIMGAAHSAEPRTVSMENTTPVGVIDISEDVVKRLTKSLKKQHELQSKDVKKNISSNMSERTDKPPAAVAGSQNQPAVPLQKAQAKSSYTMPASLTYSAADVKRQKDDELQRNNQMWRDRLMKLEADLKKTDAILQEEYEQSYANVRKRFTTEYPDHVKTPCQVLRMNVISCYRDHPKETLMCAEDVAAFRKCVSLNRLPDKLDIEQTGSATAATVKVK